MTTRRETLGVVGAAVVATITGCGGRTASGTAESDRSVASQTAATAEPARFVVRLRGPSTDRELFTGRDLVTVGDVRQFDGGQWGFTAQLSDAATERLSERFRKEDVADDSSAFQLQLRVDGETRRELGVQSSFAEAVASEEYDGRFVFTFETETTATEMQSVADSG